MSFVDQIRNSRGENLYLVRGKDHGAPAWHYVLVDKLKLKMFEKALESGSLDVADYGEVLHSGWGENPPNDLAEAIKKEYS